MPQYQVDSEQIQSSSAAVNASIQSIRQAVQGMYGNLNNLQSVWRGGAATQFTAVAEQWRAAQQQMEQSRIDAGLHVVFGDRNAGVAFVRAVESARKAPSR